MSTEKGKNVEKKREMTDEKKSEEIGAESRGVKRSSNIEGPELRGSGLQHYF